VSKKAKPSASYDVIGIRKSPLGWSVVRHTIQDGNITATETSQPDNRGIALEKLDFEISSFWDSSND